MFAALNAFLTRSAAGYFLNKSLRFRSSASAYLNRTASASISTYTISMWVKRGTLTSNYQYLFSHPNSGNTDGYGLAFNITTDTLYYYNGTAQATTAAYRDPAAWYHIVFSNNAGSFTLYVNGVSVKTGTATAIPSSAVMNLGRYGYSSTYYFDGEQAEINFVDGQALAPTAFGASSIYNQWLPIAYAGTYGTNGFYLPFTNTTGSSFSSYAGTFDGSTQSISVASNAAFQFTADFTIECWLYQTATNVGKTFYATGSSGTADIQCNITTNSVVSFYSPGGGGSAFGITGTTSLAQNTWYHVAITRSGSTVQLFVNGILDATGTNSATMPSGLSATYVGSYTTYYGNQYWFTGRISNFRVVKGTAVYTSNFIVPTAPLTAISGTSLLTLQNATIIDNSTNAFTITNNGTVVTSTQTVATAATPVNLTLDSSGNANNWTPNNISLTAGSTYDSLTDVPTLTSTTVANYAVLNPLDKDTARGTISDANLKFAATAFSTYNAEACRATMGVTTGKWYYEFCGVTQAGIGNVATSNFTTSTQNLTAISSFAGTLTNYIGASASISGNALLFQSSGYSASLANSTLFASYASGDVVNIAVDFTAGKIWVGKNGTWYNSGDPGAGTNATSTFTAPAGYNLPEFEVVTSSDNSNQSSLTVNFGQQPFVYPTLPTGFLPLNTYNI